MATSGLLRIAPVPVDDRAFLGHKGVQKVSSLVGQPLDDDLFALAIEADARLDGLHIVDGLLGRGGFGGQAAGQTAAGVELGQRGQQAGGVVGARMAPFEVRILGRQPLDLLPADRLLGPTQCFGNVGPGRNHDGADRVADLLADPALADGDDGVVALCR